MNRFNTPKTKKKKKKFVLLLIFCITFAGTVFIISEFLKNCSPAVDVNIGQEIKHEDETEFYQEANLDDRLKWIQFEDNMEDAPIAELNQDIENKNEKNQSSSKTATHSVNKKQKQPENILKEEPVFSSSNIYKNDANTNYNVPDTEQDEPPVPQITELSPQHPKPISSNVRTTKVYIGYYSSLTEANKIKNLLLNDFPSYQPVINNINGQYIVQVGIFNNRTQAVLLQMDLSDKGYPARLQTL